MADLAVFDFDGTLVHGDTLLPFLRLWVGENSLAKGLRAGARAWLAAPPDGDRRDAFKAALLRRTLAGRNPAEAIGPSDILHRRLRWHDRMVTQLRNHHAQGATILVISGALSLYLPRLLRDLPVAAAVGTELEIAQHRLTGEWLGSNCVRNGKATRLAAWLQAHGPYRQSWGYGNRPDDLPMLRLLQHQTIIP